VDAQALRGILGETKLQAMTGGVKADDTAALARAGQAAVTGTVSTEGERLKLSVRLVLLPSGKVVGQAQAYADGAAQPPLPPPPVPRAGAADSPRIEVAIRKLADGLAAGFARMPGNMRYKRLAVLPFGETGERAQKQKLGLIVAAELATDLKRDHGLLLVEREKLGQVLGEMKLQQMVSPDPATASKIGQIAEAQALVVGSISEAGDRFLVNARIVATETGESLAAESASVPAAGMVAMASDAVVLRSRGDAAFRSLIVPGLGQAYNRQPAKAWAFAGAAVALAGGAVAFHVIGTDKQKQYQDATTSEDAARLYDDTQAAFRTRNWLLVGLGTVWAVNVLDAYLSGVDGKAALEGGLAVAPVATPDGGGLLVAGRF
jgi:TolB-like protein